MVVVLVALVIGTVGLVATALALLALRTSSSGPAERISATRSQRTVEVGPGAPVPIPLGWGPDDDDEPAWTQQHRRTARSHPTMRLSHR
ncbi:MAG: hypothetical protein ACXIVQ_10455 [Acidimicrobiales bacterium]